MFLPKNGFPMPTAKNRFQILNYTPKNMYLKKHGLKEKKLPQFVPNRYCIFKKMCDLMKGHLAHNFHFRLASKLELPKRKTDGFYGFSNEPGTRCHSIHPFGLSTPSDVCPPPLPGPTLGTPPSGAWPGCPP